MIQHSNPEVQIIKNNQASCQIYADEMRIEQVIINFLTNAIKYSPGTQNIQLNVNIEKGKLHLSVIDHGIGMLPEQQEHVFDKFYRVEESSQRFQGLGIGLYICAEIIRRHGGDIGVKSEYGKGSEFYFFLPVSLKNKTSAP
ncbi:Sensor protein SrrB [compost metagenome]